jgi:hypothetical protein
MNARQTLCTLLLFTASAFAATTIDNFDGDSAGSGRWSDTTATIVEQNGRVEYVAPATDYDSWFGWTWSTPMSYSSDWSISMEMTTTIDPSSPGSSEEQWARMGLRVINGSNNTDKFSLQVEAGSVNYGGGDQLFRDVWSAPTTGAVTWGADEHYVDLGVGNDSAFLKISFDASTKTLLAECDLGDGSELQTMSIFDVDAGTASTPGWGMSEGDTFDVGINAYNPGLAVVSGELYGDNFSVTIPEPACLSVLVLGGLSMLRRKKRSRD